MSPVSVLKFQVAMSGVQQSSLIENFDIFLAFHDSRNNLNKRAREYATSLHMLSTALILRKMAVDKEFHVHSWYSIMTNRRKLCVQYEYSPVGCFVLFFISPDFTKKHNICIVCTKYISKMGIFGP